MCKKIYIFFHKPAVFVIATLFICVLIIFTTALPSSVNVNTLIKGYFHPQKDTVYSILRPDVAAAFNNHKLIKSGFYCIIPKTAIPKKFFGLPLNLSLIVLSDNPLNKITLVGIADSIRDVVIKKDCQ